MDGLDWYVYGAVLGELNKMTTYEYDRNGVWITQGGNRVYIAAQTRRGFEVMKKVLSDYGRLMGMYEVGKHSDTEEVQIEAGTVKVSKLPPGAIKTTRLTVQRVPGTDNMVRLAEDVLVADDEYTNYMFDPGQFSCREVRVWRGSNSVIRVQRFSDAWAGFNTRDSRSNMLHQAFRDAERLRCGITVETSRQVWDERIITRIDADLCQPYGVVVFLDVTG